MSDRLHDTTRAPSDPARPSPQQPPPPSAHDRRFGRRIDCTSIESQSARQGSRVERRVPPVRGGDVAD